MLLLLWLLQRFNSIGIFCSVETVAVFKSARTTRMHWNVFVANWSGSRGSNSSSSDDYRSPLHLNVHCACVRVRLYAGKLKYCVLHSYAQPTASCIDWIKAIDALFRFDVFPPITILLSSNRFKYTTICLTAKSDKFNSIFPLTFHFFFTAFRWILMALFKNRERKGKKTKTENIKQEHKDVIVIGFGIGIYFNIVLCRTTMHVV